MDIAFDTTTKPQLKTSGPHKAPPVVPQLDRNPRPHDIVAWRHDGRIESWKFETKESAIEYGKALAWCIYYQWMLMDSRSMVKKHSIPIPDGMGLDDNGLPYKVA